MILTTVITIFSKLRVSFNPKHNLKAMHMEIAKRVVHFFSRFLVLMSVTVVPSKYVHACTGIEIGRHPPAAQ